MNDNDARLLFFFPVFSCHQDPAAVSDAKMARFAVLNGAEAVKR